MSTKAKSVKVKLTKESILKAVAEGAKNMTDIAHKHGYIGNVSGDVTKLIRKLVSKIGEILADAKAGKMETPVAPVAPVEAKAPAVTPSEPPVVVVPQKKSYGGPVYGRVFEAAVQIGREQGAQPRRDVIAIVARKTALTETQVSFAMQVFTTPKHQSNQNRSRNVATVRGKVLLVPVEVEG